MAFSESIWCTCIQFHLGLSFLPWHAIKLAGYLPTQGWNPLSKAAHLLPWTFSKPKRTLKNLTSLGLVLLRGGNNMDLLVIVISTSILPATYTSWTRGWTPAFPLKNIIILGYKAHGWMGLCLLSTLIFLQAKEFWTNHQNSNNPLLINVLRALFLFLKWPLIPIYLCFEREKKWNCTGTKTKAMSDKEFC